MTAEAVHQACEDSLRRLQTDYIDLYQIHWPSRTTPLSETVSALEKLKAQGKIRAISVCNFGVKDMDDLLPLVRPETNQLPYNLIWRALEFEIQPKCVDEGIGMLCYSVLAQALLTGKYASPNEVPPAESLGGIPCLIHSFADYKRAFEIANSPYLGMEFCTGCWLEGGDEFGDMLGAIRYFHEQEKIFIVHFRNVTAPLPYFVETFLDNGYMDMYQAMKIFVEIGYDGTMILDHTPQFAGGYALGGGTAYAIGYMRALIERAEAELSIG